ncbi:MAG TPA: ABC transporter ATP-binding protein [Gemmatimonadaceae bacterium]|jgi:ABC-2 type transport system ATP-binding protein
MNVVEISQLTYRYGRVTALRHVDFSVPQGALYALLGPNGSGKTTLLQILAGLRRADSGRASVMGIPVASLRTADRRRIGYVAEGQLLPGWMRLREVEAYLAPLYDTWDESLARELCERFELDPTRKIRTLSRGEQMKAALLCALAPRPELLVMDEPFTGMDALVKDALVRGLLESAGSEGWTVLACSHDIGELELLADWVGILDHGEMRVSEPMDVVRERFKHVDVMFSSDRAPAARRDFLPPNNWLSVERSGSHVSFVLSCAVGESAEQMIAAQFGGEAQVEMRNATLRETFVALTKQRSGGAPQEVAA